MKRYGFALLGLLGLAFLMGCTTVQRVDADSVTDLSGNWNDTDSRLVAEEMVTDSLKRPWLDDFRTAKGKKPAVIVGRVINHTDEHIATQVFIENLQRELINSGRVSFVADSAARQDVRQEREDQQQNASAESMKRMRNEKGADYILQGTISTIVDAAGGTQARFYQVNLEMVDMESNEKVWIGQKQIKKLLKHRSVRG